MLYTYCFIRTLHSAYYSFHFTDGKKLTVWKIELSLIIWVGGRTRIWNHISLTQMLIWLTTIQYSKLVRKSSWLYLQYIPEYISSSLYPLSRADFAHILSFRWQCSSCQMRHRAVTFTGTACWAPSSDRIRVEGWDLHGSLAPHAESYLHQAALPFLHLHEMHTMRCGMGVSK